MIKFILKRIKNIKTAYICIFHTKKQIKTNFLLLLTLDVLTVWMTCAGAHIVIVGIIHLMHITKKPSWARARLPLILALLGFFVVFKV